MLYNRHKNYYLLNEQAYYVGRISCVHNVCIFQRVEIVYFMVGLNFKKFLYPSVKV